tara:strand:+ start:1524 stop:2552 length:1029 start_codon:yes stop_codon:yes gene_type:complete
MATFKNQVQGLTQITISGTSAPTEDELSNFLTDGVKDIINKFILLRPSDVPKFTAQSTDNSNAGITLKGRIVSIVRGNGNATDLRPCTLMDANYRHIATKKNSLHYRSALNPGFYVLNKKVYSVPASDSNNILYMSHIDYPSVTHNDSISGVAFPVEYEGLIVLYASAMACQAAAANIHANLPTKVTKLNPPVFALDDVSMPDSPNYTVPALDFDLIKVNANIKNEDLEMAEKEMDKLSKNIEKMKAIGEENAKVFNKELEIYKTELDNRVKNADRKTQIMATEYRSDLYKHQQEVAQYTAELQESLTEYKWYLERFAALMSQYNTAIGVQSPQQKQEQGEG